MSQEKKAFRIERVYLKDLSFECPSAAEPRHSDKGVAIEVSVNTEHQQRQPDGLWDVTIGVTLHYRDRASGETHYLVEAKQGGLFEITGVSDEERERLLTTECREAIFPFIRAVLWSIGGHAGWKGMLLKPMEFQQLWELAAYSGEPANSVYDA